MLDVLNFSGLPIPPEARAAAALFPAVGALIERPPFPDLGN